MEKREMLSRLREFPYDAGEYWLVAGGAMVLYGLRSETADIDLGCSTSLADRLAADGWPCTIMDGGARHFCCGDEIEIFENWRFDRIVSVEGVPVLSLDGLAEMKRMLGREKDLRDLKLINEYRNHMAES